MHEAKEDYQKLMSAVLRQGIDDYVKLQHPKHRQRKHEKEAFATAVDLFWDEDYELNILDDESKFHTLKTLCMAASGRENIEVDNLKRAIVAQSKDYWKKKSMNTINIPEQFVVGGHVYDVEHHEGETASVDYETKTIVMDTENETAEEQFLKAVLNIACHTYEIRASASARRQIGEALFQMMKVNNCFVGEQW